MEGSSLSHITRTVLHNPPFQNHKNIFLNITGMKDSEMVSLLV